jgi:putative flippase GtrA
MDHRDLWSFLRFLVSGGLNTAFAYTIFAFAILSGLHYAVAAFLGGVVPIFSGYLLQRHIVFRFEGAGRLYRFIATFFLVYMTNIGLITALQGSGFPGDIYSMGLVAVAVSSILGFSLNRYVVFRR